MISCNKKFQLFVSSTTKISAKWAETERLHDQWPKQHTDFSHFINHDLSTYFDALSYLKWERVSSFLLIFIICSCAKLSQNTIIIISPHLNLLKDNHDWLGLGRHNVLWTVTTYLCWLRCCVQLIGQTIAIPPVKNILLHWFFRTSRSRWLVNLYIYIHTYVFIRLYYSQTIYPFKTDTIVLRWPMKIIYYLLIFHTFVHHIKMMSAFQLIPPS